MTRAEIQRRYRSVEALRELRALEEAAAAVAIEDVDDGQSGTVSDHPPIDAGAGSLIGCGYRKS